MAIITTGDYAEIPFQAKKNGSPFVISGTAVIKAVLTNLDRQTIIGPEVTVNKSASGTDLNTSLIIVEFDEAESAQITELGECYLEVQIADPTPKTWTTKLTVRNGNIT